MSYKDNLGAKEYQEELQKDPEQLKREYKAIKGKPYIPVGRPHKEYATLKVNKEIAEKIAGMSAKKLNKLCLNFLNCFKKDDIVAMCEVLKTEAIKNRNLNSTRLILSFLSEINDVIKTSAIVSTDQKDSVSDVAKILEDFGVTQDDVIKQKEEDKPLENNI